MENNKISEKQLCFNKELQICIFRDEINLKDVKLERKNEKENIFSSAIPKIKTQKRMQDPLTPKASIEFSIELKKVINERNILTSKTRKRVFEALDEIKTKSEEETRHFKRERALLEIINSEIKYVHQLETIINFFLKPTKEGKLLKSDDFQIVFGHINTIYNVNKVLLEHLDKGSKNVANAFTKVIPFLKLYSAYALDFKYILSILQVSTFYFLNRYNLSKPTTTYSLF